MASDLVPTRRHLEAIQLSDREIRITGWLLATDGDAIRDMTVRSHPVGLVKLRGRQQSASDDVLAAHPGYPAAKACRFQLLLETIGTPPKDGFLIELRPVFDRGLGRSWHLGIGLRSPPDEQVRRVGGGHDVGLEFLDYFVDFAGLSDHESILDFGCGTGRMALPLARFLGPSARYLGVDVDPRLIAWCNDHIARDDTRFTFITSAARNALYRPDGSAAACGSIPVPDAVASFSFATSVFTHLRANEAETYLSELARATRAGGRVLITAFLFDDASANTVDFGQGPRRFVPLDDLSWTTDPSLPETAMAFRLATLVSWARSASLHLRCVHQGTWSGRPDGLSFQDLLIFDRK